VTVLGFGGAGGGVVGNGDAGTPGGGGGASMPGGMDGGLAPGSNGCAAMIEATTVPCESQSNRPPFASPIT
jgi:nuclear receptor co-repressor 1